MKASVTTTSGHDTQTNDYLADACMDAYFGRPPRWKAPVPWTLGGSENHKIEGSVLGLIQNPGSPVALRELIRRLEQQTVSGHQGKELATPSHAPHWYRAMSMALWFATKHPELGGLLETVRSWWAADSWIREQYRVPRGPLAGQVIGWGGRFNGGGRNEVRDVIDTLIRDSAGDKGAGVRKSGKYFENAKVFRDTFPVVVVRDLAAQGSFRGVEPEKPAFGYDLTIDRRSDSLSCICSNPAGGDPREVHVDYESGKVQVVP
jgi:hypothetical protein